jgi:PHD/YefM family antitoxin component YafN of YafNO toxin-antitoxin module
MVIAVSWAEFVRKPSQFVNETEPVHITRADGNHQVLISEKELSAINETLAIMSNKNLMERLERSKKMGKSKFIPITDDHMKLD